MPMVRTVQCDICEQRETENQYGNGWPGWAIISGIAAKTPKDNDSLTDENMRFILCPEHTSVVANILTNLQHEYHDSDEVS